MNDEQLYDKAKKRVEEIKGFHSHLVVFILVNVGLFLFNYFISKGTWWFYWPLLGWGIGLVIHGFNTFGTHLFLGQDWEDKKIKELVEKYKEKE